MPTQTATRVPHLGAPARRMPVPAARSRGWTVAWRDAALAVLVARLVSWGAAAWGHGDPFAAATQRWDAQHLHGIAVGGYPDQLREAWAFWPGYPVLVAAFGGSWTVGVLVSLLCSVAALALLRRLAEEELGAGAARRAVWLVALFPAAWAFGSFYTESLFLLETVGAVYAARRGRWALAGLAGAAAALTRNTGVLLVLALGWEAWRQRAAWRAAWLALVPAAPFTFLAVAQIQAGDWLAPAHVGRIWGRGWHGPLAAVPEAFDQAREALAGTLPVSFEPAWMVVGQLALVLGAGVALVGVLRRLPLGWGLYAGAALAVPLSEPWPEHPLMSVPRYLAVLFPLHLWLAARTGRRAVLGVALAVSVAGLALLSARFGGWQWAG